MKSFLKMRIVYRRENDNDDWTLFCVGSSPEEAREELSKLYGSLPYFRCEGREDIHLILPSVEKYCYLKQLKKLEENIT